MDRLLEMVEASNKIAFANADNNDPMYVGARYDDLCGSYCSPLEYKNDHLFPSSKNVNKNCEWTPSNDGNGIFAVMLSNNDKRLQLYRVVSNGRNGVMVSEKICDLDP